MTKIYGDGASEYTRRITKPVTSTVRIAMNGAVVNPSDYSVDYLSGIISFNSLPASGAIVTAGFEFDVPVRFDMERLDISMDDFETVQITDVPLIEVLDHV